MVTTSSWRGGSLGHRGGGSVQQPLAYLDPTIPSPNASAGSNLLKQDGLVLRPVIPRQNGGVQQPLAYLDTTLPVPSAPTGRDLLEQNGLILRPIIPRQNGGFNRNSMKSGGFNTNSMSGIASTSNSDGFNTNSMSGIASTSKSGGFLPSVMKGVVNSGVILAPLATFAAHRMMNATRKRGSQGGSRGGSRVTTDHRGGSRGGGKKEDWARNRDAARDELSKYGKPSALNINKYAGLKRKNGSAANDWLTDYIVKKRTVKKGKKEPVSVKNAVQTNVVWNELVNRAKKNLEPFGKPSGANTRKFASLRKKGQNTQAFLTNFKTRKQYVSPVKTPKNTYLKNRGEAQKYLSQFGKPTVANVSKFVSLKRKGEQTKTVENTVKSRVKPVSVKASPPPEYIAKMKRNLALLHKKLEAIEGQKK